MCFLYLFLGHLLGDFVMQTNRIADNKIKYWQWNALHAAIVTLCMLLLSIPFGLLVMVLVLVNGVFHYYVDLYKPKIADQYHLPGVVYFLADQVIHIFAIYLISKLAVVNAGFLFFDRRVIKVLLVIAFVSSFAAVLNQYILNMLYPDSNKRFFEADEKSMGNLTRLVTVFGLYFSYTVSPSFLVFIASIIITLMVHYRKKWRMWMSHNYFVTKFFADMIMSLVGLAFLMYF